jgi:shikimate kinase
VRRGPRQAAAGDPLRPFLGGPEPNRKMNITLIGMPGAGKSTVGRELARRLDYRLIDTDDLIRQETGLTIGENLTRLGDAGFIQLEEEIVLHLGDLDRCVVSPGGSVVYSRKAMEFLRQKSVVIFLKVPVKVIQARVGPQRGVVRLQGRTLPELFGERLPLYEKYAHRAIDADGEAGLVAEEIVGIMQDVSPMCPQVIDSSGKTE